MPSEIELGLQVGWFLDEILGLVSLTFGLEGSALLLASGQWDKSNPWHVVMPQFFTLSQWMFVIKCQLRHRGTRVSIQKCMRIPATSNSHKHSYSGGCLMAFRCGCDLNSSAD